MIDPELFKKLDDTDIWEFRTFYNKIKYRLLALGDKDNGTNTPVIATHGFIKKTQKTPSKEIAKAEEIRKEYFRKYGQKCISISKNPTNHSHNPYNRSGLNQAVYVSH